MIAEPEARRGRCPECGTKVSHPEKYLYCLAHRRFAIECLNCHAPAEVNDRRIRHCPRCIVLPRCSRCKRHGHHTPRCHWSGAVRRPVPVYRGVLTEEDFEAFYTTHVKSATFYAAKFVGLEDAQDIVQGVFLYHWRRLDSLPDLRITRLLTWVKFAAKAELKSAWRRHLLPLGSLSDVELHAARHDHPQEAMA